VAADRADRRRARHLSSLRQPQAGAGIEATMADALVIRGLSKRFGGLRAVQDVSFSVRENETLALIGPNGAGKTTSFHLITGFHRPDSGSVVAYGREIMGLRPHDICAHGVARTFQVAKPFGAMTVLANVMTGAFLRDRNTAVAREKAREVIEFVGLSAREQTAAKDLTTIDQRRLEMARALATQPRLLLLDEVMAGLNPAEIDQAVALIGKLSQRGLTIVIVEHVMRAIMAVARHIVVLDHGQKIAEGAPKEIVENPEVVRAYLGSGYVPPPTAGER
jgi:branched-chain amino acid transport system ATP-binding protein